LPDIVELVCKIPVSKGPLISDQQHHDLLKLGSSTTIAPRFEELPKSLGFKLLSPLQDRCFEYREDIWLYKFCVGNTVEQFHVEPDGSFSEEFKLGNSNMSLATT
jgi:Glucosidase II beta subunit-like protein